jgi:glycosyltransferase involved in cell wall biosynthesis
MMQHSHQLALALHEQGWLKAYWSGIPVASPGESPPFWMPERLRRRVKTVDIPASLRRHPLRFQLGLRAGARLPPAVRGAPHDLEHRISHWFDTWTAHRINALRPQVVIAYENAAYHTFAAAKAVGAFCVLDAASLHQRFKRQLLTEHPDTPFNAEVSRRKDVEVECADLVLTCSPLAAESYVAEGVPASKIRPLLLGAELPVQQTPGPAAAPKTAPRFLFAGGLRRLKSIDLILQAFGRLAREGLAYELHFVGDLADPELAPLLQDTPHVTHLPGVPQSELYPLMAQADCLLLPSRFDSFGMVVAEAMACGTPALVSTCTGAKAMIEQTPGSGWIVEPEADAIHDQVRALLLDPAQLAHARDAARRAAEPFSWQAYRARAAALLSDVLN